jgi:carbon starvation protein
LWREHYTSWDAAAGLGPKIDVFVTGGAGFLSPLGVPEIYATTFLAVILLSFSITTIDSSTRLLRYTLADVGNAYNVKFLKNAYVGSLIAVFAAGSLALWKYGGKEAGMMLWPIFGTTIQVLAALALLVVTIWLLQIRKPIVYTGIPMVFMLVVAGSAMVYNVVWFYIPAGNSLLTGIGLVIMVLAVWLVFEAISCLRNGRKPN